MLSTVQLPAVTLTGVQHPLCGPTVQADVVSFLVAESVSVKTVVKPVSTVIIATTVTWHQNVVEKVTSTLVWRVFTTTTGEFSSRAISPGGQELIPVCLFSHSAHRFQVHHLQLHGHFSCYCHQRCCQARRSEQDSLVVEGGGSWRARACWISLDGWLRGIHVVRAYRLCKIWDTENRTESSTTKRSTEVLPLLLTHPLFRTSWRSLHYVSLAVKLLPHYVEEGGKATEGEKR